MYIGYDAWGRVVTNYNRPYTTSPGTTSDGNGAGEPVFAAHARNVYNVDVMGNRSVGTMTVNSGGWTFTNGNISGTTLNMTGGSVTLSTGTSGTNFSFNTTNTSGSAGIIVNTGRDFWSNTLNMSSSSYVRLGSSSTFRSNYLNMSGGSNNIYLNDNSTFTVNSTTTITGTSWITGTDAGTFLTGVLSLTNDGSSRPYFQLGSSSTGGRMQAIIGAMSINGQWTVRGGLYNGTLSNQSALVVSPGANIVIGSSAAGNDTELRFDGGSDLYNNVTIRSASTAPLSTYNKAINDAGGIHRGLATVFGNITIGSFSSSDSQFQNRFIVNEGNIVTLAVEESTTAGPGPGATLTFTGVNAITTGTGSKDKGGVFFIKADSPTSGQTRLLRNYVGGPTGHYYGTLAFYNNRADTGAAIHALQHLDITGLTYFDTNYAVSGGGAIYMEGSASSNILNINTEHGAIVFQNNTIGSNVVDDPNRPGSWITTNSIFLEKRVTLNFLGQRDIYIDDGISAQITGRNEANVMNIDISPEGFVQFGQASRSYFSRANGTGGAVNVNEGIFRVVGDKYDVSAAPTHRIGEFSTLGGDSVFTVAQGATLAGGGKIAAGKGFVINGILAADSYRYQIPADLKHTGQTKEWGSNVGTMTLLGNVTFDKTEFLIDTENTNSDLHDDYKSSDTIIIRRLVSDQTIKDTGKLIVNGDPTSGSDDRTTIDITNWLTGSTTGKFLIAAVEGGIVNQSNAKLTNDNVMDYFTIVSSGTGELKGRTGASLFLTTGVSAAWDDSLDQDTEMDLVLHTSDKANLYLYWNGTQSEVWNQQESVLNWYRRGSAADMAAMRNTDFHDTDEKAFFLTGDYVYFTADAEEPTVETRIPAGSTIVVSGMEILGGDYLFVGEAIYGQLSSRPLETTAGTDNPFIGVVATAILKIDNAKASFDVETKFDGGTVLSNGADVVLRGQRADGYNYSLGAYDTARNKTGETADMIIERGVVKVTEGTVSVGTEIDQKVMLHFEVLDGATLTFDLADGSTFTIDGVVTHNAGTLIHRGGAINLTDQGKFVVAGNDVTMIFSNNSAFEGGAIYAPRDLTITGNTAFLDNIALDNGGAIYMNGAGHQTLAFDTTAGNIVFDGNIADGSPNSVHLYKQINMAFTGDNNVLFNDPVTAGSIGYNRLSAGADFTGIVQFRGENTFNNEGAAFGPGSDLNKMELLGGTFRLAGNYNTVPDTYDAQLNLGGTTASAFTLGQNAMIAGQGQITMYAASKGFLIQGALSPDSDTFTSKLVPGAQDKFQVADTANIGRLNFVGNMRLDSAKLIIDMDGIGNYNPLDPTVEAGNTNDRILVTGRITLDNTLAQNTVLTTAEFGTSGDFMILKASEGIIGANNAQTAQELLKYFNGSNQLGARQRGDLEFRKDITSSATTLFDELWLTNVQSGMNAKIYWTGAYTTQDAINPLVEFGEWDLNATYNWTSNGLDELKFLDYDYVLFDNSKAADGIVVNNYHAKLTGQDMTVVGMDILSGNYEITSDNGTRQIIGRKIHVGTPNDPYLPFDEQTGQLRILGGSVRLGVATDFYAGTYVEGGTVYLVETTAGTPGSSASLGVYNHADYSDYNPVNTVLAGSRQGYVEVGGTGTIAYNTGAAPTTESEMTATNRYKVLANGNLQFDIAESHTLFTRGIDVTAGTVDNNGAVIFFEDGGQLNFIGDGTVHFGGDPAVAGNSNVAVSGGVIYAAGDFAFGGNVIFEGNRATSGGAVYAQGVTITDTTATVLFLKNAATDGGAIYATDSVTISGDTDFGMIDSTIPSNPVYIGNTATNSGGAIYLANANGNITFDNGTANFYGNTAATGGAIYGNDFTLTVTGASTDVLFERNSATDGGAIYVANAITIDGNVDFGRIDLTDPGNPVYVGNTATNSGGAVYFANANAAATIDGGTVNFYGNTAASGGAVYSEGGFHITGTDTSVLFEGNRSNGGQGGAVYAVGGVTIDAETIFTNNLVQNPPPTVGGGAIMAKSVTIETGGAGTSFTGNKVLNPADAITGHGGAILATEALTIYGETTFTGNQAGLGGAVYAANATIANATGTVGFFDNMAIDGGAINVENSLTISGDTDFGRVDPNNNTLYTDVNTAARFGGAVYSGSNVAINAGDVRFYGNTAADSGGAVYSVQDVNISGTDTNATFQGNTATNFGGAVYAGRNTIITGNSSNFIANRAVSGGAIYALGGVRVSGASTNALFQGNEATGNYGGAIYTTGHLTISGASVDFIANRALGAGGAVYVTAGDGKQITIGGNTRFLDNTAVQSGGAIALGGGTGILSKQELTLDADGGDIIFDNNTAADGGAIHTGDWIDVTMEGDSQIFFGSTDTLRFGTRSVENNSSLEIKETVKVIMTAQQNSFNIGNMNVGADAELFLQTGSTFSVSNGTFSLAGTLSGSGLLDNTGGSGIVISGTLDPNNYRYTYDRNLGEIVQTGTNVIGTLTLGGDVLMSGAKLKIDIQENNVSDLVKITKDLAVDSSGTVVVDFATGFHQGVFDIITADNELHDVLDGFVIDSSMLGERNKATLRIKKTDDDPETPAEKTIQLVTDSNGNLKLYWTGDDGMTGTSDQNWYAHNSLVGNWIVGEDTNNPQPFLNGDYVVFNDAAYVLQKQAQTVTVKSHMNENDVVDVIVTGMEILGGDYTFSATAENSRIVGDPSEGLYVAEKAQADDKIGMLWISGTDTSATFNLKLKFSDDIVVTDGAVATFDKDIETDRYVRVNSGASATFNGVSTLAKGAALNNATVTLGNDKALDDYSEFIAGTNQRGVVDISGDVTVKGSRDLELKNYFTLQDASTLTFELDGTSLAIDTVGGIDLSAGNAALVVNTVGTDDRFVFNGLVTAGTAGANNSFTKRGEGTVVFNGGNHDFNTVAGTDNSFHVREGEMRLVNSTVNSTDGEFLFDAGTTLSGSGAVNAGANGTITLGGSINADDFDVSGSDIGQLAFTGNVILDGATINVNLDQQTRTSDRLSVTGSVGFGSGDNTTVDVNIVGNWIADEYLIVDTTEKFSGMNEQDILAHFNLTYNNEQLNSRQEATLSVKNDLKDLYLTLHDAKNLQLTWNGVSSSDVWNTSLNNWLTADGKAINFLDGDTVIFTDAARQKDVEIAGNWLVGGMEIQSGSYSFTGGKITGGVNLSNDTAIATGRFDILTDGTVTINNEMAFENGISISGNTTIVLGNDKALGELDRAGKNNDEGVVYILGENVTIRTDGQADRNVRNQLMVASDSALTVEAVAGTKLTFRNVSDSRAVTASGDVTFLGNVDFSDNLGAVAMIGANLTLAPNATFTNNRALTDGGAIVGYADSTVSVFGNTLFEGNRAGSNLLDGKGGAIFMDGGTLNLNTAAGEIVFRNNVATSSGSTYTNAIHLEDGAELNIAGQNDVYFYDALSAASTGSANRINIAMGGTKAATEPGTVHFFGNSVLNNTAFAHNAGGLRLEEGASLNAENSFAMAAGARLLGNGTIASTDISLSGDISADSFDRDGAGSAIGEIRLDGDTVLKSANLVVDLGNGSVSDRLSIDGTATFVNTNLVTLNNWKSGTFNLVLAMDGITGFHKDNWDIKDSDSLSARQRWSFDVVNVQQSQALQLTTVTRNDVLTWTNAAGNQTWDTKEKNWEGTLVHDENGYLDCFLDLDYTVFSGRGEGDVNIVQDGVITGGMLISAGKYAFAGGSLNGQAVDGSDFQDGVLTIRGGQSLFKNDVYFQNGINISGADTLVAIDLTGKMWTDRLFLVDTGATFVFTPTEDIIKGGSVVFKGEIITLRPKLDDNHRAYVANVIEVYDAPIDQAAFDAIFDGKTQGLYGQFTAYSPDGMKMDLNYRPVTVWEFSESNKLSWNMNEASKGLSDVFNDAMIGPEFCELRDCMEGEDMTNADVIAILDSMRGTEMGAAALEIALWSPWRTVFNHLSQDQALQPAPAYGNVRGQVGTQQASTRDFWIEAFHRTTEASADVKTSGYKIARTGTIMGLDKKLDMYTTLGAALNYNTPQLTSRFGKIEATDWGLALYAKRYITEEIYLNSYIGFGHQEYKYQRHEGNQTHRTRYDGNSLYASTELVKPVIWRSGGTLLPLIALDFQKSWAGDFVESDLAYAKRVTDGELESSMVRFGLNSRWILHERVSLDTRFQYSYKFSGDSDGRVNATFANAPAGGYQMNFRGVELGRDFLNVGIGGQTYLNSCRTLHLFGDYDYDIGNKSYSHTAQLGFVYQW